MLKNITLSQDEMSVILGGLLGDAHLRTDNQNAITFRHCKKQKEYIEWKYDILKNISTKISNLIDQNGFEYIRFSVGSNKYLRNNLYSPLKVLIYENGIKTVNRKWLNMLTPLSLAVWWMDDGNLSIHKGNRYGKLCTNCFSKKEHQLIKQYFKVVWKIDIQIKLEKNKYYFCRFNVENLKRLFVIIYPYIIQIPSMIYKIDLNYKNDVKLGDFTDIYNAIKSHKLS